MKKILFAATALALTAGSALAADLPSRKGPPMLPPPPPPPMWTGFYVGLNAGYTWSNSNNVSLATAPFFLNPGVVTAGAGAVAAAAGATAWLPTQTDGFIGGGQIGYNWQFAGSFVAGIEADIQGVASNNSWGSAFTVVPTPPPAGAFFANSALQASRSLDYLGTVRGRLGWLFTPTLLVYGTGGLAYGGVNLSTSLFQIFTPFPGSGVNPFFGATAFSDTRVGWTAGGGLEWMFWPNWSAKVEYLYYDLGTVTTNVPVVATFPVGGTTPFFGNATQSTARFDGHIVRAGLNYHFNWGAAPVVAKY